MDLYLRQQFDFLLATAVDRFVERLEQRNQGSQGALRKIQTDPQGEGVWLQDFVAAIFQDFLLDNEAGACYVLQALAKQPHAAVVAGQVGTTLIALAQATFASLLREKTIEVLEQRSGYQSVQAGGH